jgi:DNA repair exonuclease SbcCD ATPase subunit
MKRIFVSIVAMLFISVLFMACADEKGPAELAMKAAEQAVAATKAEAEKLVPDQVAALESALASAKDKLAKGEFKEALSEAQGLVGKAKDVLAAAQARKNELTQKWTELSQGLPQMVEAIQGKVDDLSKLKKLPKKITTEKLAEAKSGLEAVKADLAKAQESFKSGNIAEAIAVATAVKEKAVKAMGSLGITAPEPAKS